MHEMSQILTFSNVFNRLSLSLSNPQPTKKTIQKSETVDVVHKICKFVPTYTNNNNNNPFYALLNWNGPVIFGNNQTIFSFLLLSSLFLVFILALLSLSAYCFNESHVHVSVSRQHLMFDAF